MKDKNLLCKLFYVLRKMYHNYVIINYIKINFIKLFLSNRITYRKSGVISFYSANGNEYGLRILNAYVWSFSTKTIIVRIAPMWYGVFHIPWRTDLCIPRRTIDINLNSSAAARCCRAKASRNTATPISRCTLCSWVSPLFTVSPLSY